MSQNDKLMQISNEILNFTESPLYSYRIENKYFPVIGEGSHEAHIMFVGEAPGENEAKTGKPFCGRSGKMLDLLLESIKLDRTNVYITNLVKDRPPENRDPKTDEIALYGPYILRQIEIIKPRVVVTLGRHSMQYIFEAFGLASKLDVISKIHGQEFVGQTSYGNLLVVALYHPAVALYNGGMKGELMKDFKILEKYK